MFDCVPIVFRLTQFLTSEIDIRAKTQQLDFLKNHCFELRHFRSTWDLRIRSFDEAHPAVPCKISFRAYFLHFLRISLGKKYVFLYTYIGCVSLRAFHPYIQSVAAFSVSRQIDFCVSAQDVQSICMLTLTIRKYPSARRSSIQIQREPCWCIYIYIYIIAYST